MLQYCTNCADEITVSPEKLSTGWVFIKCTRCGSHSPIRGGADSSSESQFKKLVIRPMPQPQPREVKPPPLPIVQSNFEPKMEKPIRTRNTNTFSFFVSFFMFLLAFAVFDRARHKYRHMTQVAVVSVPEPVPNQQNLKSGATLTEAPKTNHETLIKIVAKAAVLRGGPGTQFRKMGIAQEALRFIVKEEKQDWYEIRLTDGTIDSAWIRKDLVKVINTESEQANL